MNDITELQQKAAEAYAKSGFAVMASRDPCEIGQIIRVGEMPPDGGGQLPWVVTGTATLSDFKAWASFATDWLLLNDDYGYYEHWHFYKVQVAD